MKDKGTSSQKKRIGPGSGQRGNADDPIGGSGKRSAQTEALFRAVFDNSRDAIGVSKAGVHVCVNRAYGELFGFPPGADLAGKPVLDLIAADSRDQIREYIRRRARGESTPSSYETRGLRVDGSEFDMEVNVSLYQENGEDHTLVTLRDITRRKMADEEIAERGVLVQQIMDTASVAIGLVDKRGRFIHANRRMAEMFGCTMEELLGSEYVDHVHPAERETSRESMLALLASKIPSVDLERLYWRKDGTEFWGHLACRRFHDARGNELGLIGVITDISERKRSEEALRQSEAKFRRLYNETPVLLHSIDRDGVLVDVNDYWLKTLGYERTEVIGRKVTDFHTDASRTYAREVVQPAFFRDGIVKDISYQFVKKNGDVVDVLLSATAERDAAGNIVRSQAVIEDVTERKRVEREIREKEGKYRVLFEAANDGIFIQDASGFTDCNRKGAEMYGLSKEEVIGRSPIEFAPKRQPDGRLSAEVAGEKIQAALNGVPQVFEWQPMRADGTPFDVEITLSRLELGGKMCLQAIVRDISERKRLEQERVKSQKLESLGTLAGGIAHDFNNLLQGVFGFISMAKMTLDQKEKSLAMLEQAEKALHQTVNLTTQLLTFSKGGKPVKRKTALPPMIENAARFALSGSRTGYLLRSDPGLWQVEADEGQLGQVIQNIVLNADQAMPLGGSVVISARNLSASDASLPQELNGRDTVLISVQDSGIGITEQYLGNIFDPYFTTKEKGSGLGLATSYSIIKNHGGVIRVQSEVGKGATFFIYLPASGAGGEQLKSAEVRAGTRKYRVLVMDDEEIIRNVAKELLRELGHEGAFAEKGETALDAYQAAQDAGRPFDIVILDLTIRGGMGGIETLRKLRQIDPDVKAIVSSGYSDDAALSNYSEQGFRAFLKKPYDMQELQHTLQHLLP